MTFLIRVVNRDSRHVRLALAVTPLVARGDMTKRTGQSACVGRVSRTVVVVAFLLITAGCGGGTTAPSSTTTLHSEVSDPSGDALSDPSVPISPDLVHGTVDVSAGNIT